ncbi:hypothetical protein KSP40_PGU019338 [Platanthera guangdongensis]|uniref:Secreted protein n=1 Tax=Platanthera guangdongensis TaxID=2320717 RepID=A0ABR2MHJ8_9ASPA
MRHFRLCLQLALLCGALQLYALKAGGGATNTACCVVRRSSAGSFPSFLRRSSWELGVQRRTLSHLSQNLNVSLTLLSFK